MRRAPAKSAYARSRRSAIPFLALLSILSACGREAVTEPKFKLTVRWTAGISGTPAVGDESYAAGSTVEYSYSAMAGFDRLNVLVDGVDAPLSGTIIMDRDRTLGAAVSRIPVVPEVAKSDVEELTAVLTGLNSGSTSPMEAYRALGSTVSNLSGKVPTDSIPRLIRLATLQAFTADQSDVVARALREISDSLACHLKTLPRAAAATGAPEVVFLYINGIWTELGTAQYTAEAILAPLVQQAGYSDPVQYRVESFHNPGSTPKDLSDLVALACFSRDAAALLEGSTDPHPRCVDLMLLAGGGDDLQQAYAQVIARSINAGVNTTTSIALADRIQSLAQDSRVVIVAHSQGNLFVHEAFRELERRSLMDPGCIGTVSLAPPLPISPLDMSPLQPVQMFVAGNEVEDLLLWLEDLKPGTFPGIRTVPSYETVLSARWDRLYGALSDFWLNVLSLGMLSVKAAQVRLAGSLDLHSVDRSYLTYNKTRTTVALHSEVRNTESNCVAFGRSFSNSQFSLIPPGTFQMGSANGVASERPEHTVTLTKAFELQKTEVTREQWRAVMGTDPGGYILPLSPAGGVSWEDIQGFLQRLNDIDPGKGYRLPTEAEWEYAARAGTVGGYGGTGVLDQMGWYQSNAGGVPHAVAEKTPNAWGLYDMHGNVSEWVQDWYSHTYYSDSPGLDPTGPPTGEFRVLRGGNAGLSSDGVTSFARYSAVPYYVNADVGFRLARSTDQAPSEVASVAIVPSSASVVVSGTLQFTAVPRDAAGNTLAGRTVWWSSSDESVANVTATGLARGVDVGTATITATSEGVSASAEITVSRAPVATVTVSPSTASVLVQGNLQLAAILRDVNGGILTGRTVEWSSDDRFVVSVDASGLVYGVRVGTATITATSEGKSGSATVTVLPLVATVTVTPSSSSIVVGASAQLIATLRDADGNILSGRTIFWSSNNPAAIVTSTGLVTGMVPGTATITATSEGISGSADVTVTAAPVATVTVSPTTASIAVGGVRQFDATLRDANGNTLTGRTVTWSTSDNTVATVSAAGLAAGVAVGTATIYASSEGRYGSATLTVTESSGGPTITSIMPSSGTSTGGVAATIHGSGFTGATGTTVTVNGAATLQRQILSSTEVRVFLGPGTAGTGDVVVQNSGGSATCVQCFTYTDPGAPSVRAVQPAATSPIGGGVLEILGADLKSGADANTTSVYVGGTPVGSKYMSAANPWVLLVQAPAGAVGSADLRISTPLGESTCAGCVEYLPTEDGLPGVWFGDLRNGLVSTQFVELRLSADAGGFSGHAKTYDTGYIRDLWFTGAASGQLAGQAVTIEMTLAGAFRGDLGMCTITLSMNGQLAQNRLSMTGTFTNTSSSCGVLLDSGEFTFTKR